MADGVCRPKYLIKQVSLKPKFQSAKISYLGLNPKVGQLSKQNEH